MDQLAIINLGSIFAIFVLPAWTVFRLQNPKISIIIGGLIFWCWLVLLDEFIRGFYPSYDSFAPALNFLFGLPFGLGYCAFWEGIRKLFKRTRKASPSFIDLIVWSFPIASCIGLPFIFKAIYRRDPIDYLFEILFGIGPIFLLCMSLFLTTTFEIYSRKKASMTLHLDAAARRE